MKSYHFDLGNSSTGPIGFSARVKAENRAEAVKKLRAAVPKDECLIIDNPPGSIPDPGVTGEIEYLAVYFNASAVTEADIDEVNDD